jgi:hypothetical protein
MMVRFVQAVAIFATLSSICGCSNAKSNNIDSAFYKQLNDAEKNFANVAVEALYGDKAEKHFSGHYRSSSYAVNIKGKCFGKLNVDAVYDYMLTSTIGNIAYTGVMQCGPMDIRLRDKGYVATSYPESENTNKPKAFRHKIWFDIGNFGVSTTAEQLGFSRINAGYFSNQVYCKLFTRVHVSGEIQAIVDVTPSNMALFDSKVEEGQAEQYIAGDDRLAECLLRSMMMAYDLEGGATLPTSLIAPLSGRNGYKPCQRAEEMQLYIKRRISPSYVDQRDLDSLAKSPVTCRLPPQPTMYAIAFLRNIIRNLPLEPQMVSRNAFRELVAIRLRQMNPLKRDQLIVPTEIKRDDRNPAPPAPPPAR